MFPFFAEAWKWFAIDWDALDHVLVLAMIGARWGQSTFVQFTPDGKWRIYQCPAGKYRFDHDSVYIYVPSCPDRTRGPIKAGYLDRHPDQAMAAFWCMDSAAKYVIAQQPRVARSHPTLEADNAKWHAECTRAVAS